MILVEVMCGYRGKRMKMERSLRAILLRGVGCTAGVMQVSCELPRLRFTGAGMKQLRSLDHSQHSGHQLLLNDDVHRWTVLHLQDDLMGFPEEVLPHSCLHSLVPCGQPGTPFKDWAATTYRLYQEGKRMGMGALVANCAS